MPNYDYKCGMCGDTHEVLVKYEDRFCKRPCIYCAGMCEYVFPYQALNGYQETEAYFDEGLGVDVNGKREQRQIMQGQGVIEAGDKQGGGREWDKDHINAIKMQKPKGITYSDIQRREEKARIMKENTIVTAMQGDGREVAHRVGDNESDTRKSISVKHGNSSGRQVS